MFQQNMLIVVGLLVLYGCLDTGAYMGQDVMLNRPYTREDMIRGLQGITVVDVGDPISAPSQLIRGRKYVCKIIDDGNGDNQWKCFPPNLPNIPNLPNAAKNAYRFAGNQPVAYNRYEPYNFFNNNYANNRKNYPNIYNMKRDYQKIYPSFPNFDIFSYMQKIRDNVDRFKPNRLYDDVKVYHGKDWVGKEISSNNGNQQIIVGNGGYMSNVKPAKFGHRTISKKPHQSNHGGTGFSTPKDIVDITEKDEGSVLLMA